MGVLPHTTAHREHSSASSEIMAETKPAVPEPYQEHGALIDHKVPQDDVVQAQPDLAWSRIRRTLREPFSEFFGMTPIPILPSWLT